MERVAQEAIYCDKCVKEHEYYRDRNENPPNAETPLGTIAGFEIIARPTYTEVKRVYPRAPDARLSDGPEGATGPLAQYLSKEPKRPNRAAERKEKMDKSVPERRLREIFADTGRRSQADKALATVYRYFSGEHMKGMERNGCTRSASTGRIVVNRSTARTDIGGGVADKLKREQQSIADAPASPPMVSVGVQCEARLRRSKSHAGA